MSSAQPTAAAERSRHLLGNLNVGQRVLLQAQQTGPEVVSVVEVGLDSEGDPLLVVVGPNGARRTVDAPSVISGRIQLSDDLKLSEDYLAGASYPVAKMGWGLDARRRTMTQQVSVRS